MCCHERRSCWVPFRSHCDLLFSYCLAFISQGIVMALVGPTLIQLGHQTNSSVDALSSLFSSRACGLFIGVATGGYVIDNYPLRLQLGVGFCLLTMGVTSFLVPLPSSLAVLCCLFVIQAITLGFLDSSVQILLIKLCDKHLGPYMQALHMTFAVGTVVAPGIASTFVPAEVSPAAAASTEYANAFYVSGSFILVCSAYSFFVTVVKGQNPYSPDFVNVFKATPVDEEPLRDERRKEEGHGENINDTIMLEVVGQNARSTGGSSAEMRYFEVADLNDPLDDRGNAGVLKTSQMDGKVDDRAEEAENTSEEAERMEDKMDSRSRLIVVIITCCFLFLYMGVEWGFGNFVAPYTVKHLNSDERTAAYVTNTYWVTFMIGRVIGIGVAQIYAPQYMVIADFSVCFAAILLIFTFNTSLNILYVGAGLYGLGVATVWASTMMYMENTVGLSGVYMTALTVSASTGDAILPILMGVAFEQIGPLGVIYICLFALIGSNVLIIVVMKYVSCYQTNRVPSVPKHDEKQEMQQEDTNVVN